MALSLRGQVVKFSYDNGYFTNTQIAKWVKNGKLTEEDYEIITGEKYSATAE